MTVLENKFEQMGARVQIREPSTTPLLRSARGPLSIDVRRDRRGEYFDLAVRPDVSLEVLSVDARDRHLVLMARDGREKSRFLCGHDEREWFVAAIPERTPVTTVADAKEALKPEGVVRSSQLRRRERGRRHTSAYLRQGEWFFLPRPDFDPGDRGVLRNEIITRTGRGGKPHVCAEMVRVGGRITWLHRSGLRVLTNEEYLGLTRWEQDTYSQQRRDARVFVRGTVRHPDHATLKLPGWHEVLLNTEQSARAMSHVAFVD